MLTPLPGRPTSIRDRLTTRYELLFMLVTQPDHYFDLDPIRQPNTGNRALSRRAHYGGTKPDTLRGTWPRTPEQAQRGRNPGNVWSIPPDRSRTVHPAPSPLAIPRCCIAAGCPPAGRVLDPFSGSGTTGIDTNTDYHQIAMQRLDHRDNPDGATKV